MDRDRAEPSVDAFPGPRAERLAARQSEVAAVSTQVYEFVWDRSAPADGPFCTDVDGNVLLDFTCHVAAAPLGYDNPKIAEPLADLGVGDPMKIAGQDFYVSNGPDPDDAIPGPVDLMERLTDITDHYDMGTVFLSNSGAEAVENAIKVCYDHEQGRCGITFQGAFHGRTLGTLSLNRSKGVYRRDFPAVAGIQDVPYCADRACTAETCGCGFFTDDASQLRAMLDDETGALDASEVSYLILEPLQGEGGYRIPSDAFVDEVAAVADEHDLLVISDEIQAGMGRTGEWWGVDHWPLDPDVICGAKALRVGATVGRDEVFPDERSRLSSTWGGGDVLGSLLGTLTIDAIEEHDLLAHARTRGRDLVERLDDAFADHDAVTDVRGRGLMVAVDFATEDLRDDVQARAAAHGLLVLGCGHRTIRVLPPLDVTEREIELGVRLLARAVDDVS